MGDRNDNDQPPMKDCELCQGRGTLTTPVPGGGTTESTCTDCDGNRRVPA